MEGESGITRSIIDKLHSWDIKWKVKVILLEVSLISFIVGISNEIKWKVTVVFFEVSMMNFLLRRSKETKWKVKVVLLEV